MRPQTNQLRCGNIDAFFDTQGEQMKCVGNQRFLAAYSGILTLTFAITILAGFGIERRKRTFEEIDVQRINLVEPDGTLRMVISDKALWPGIYLKGKEHPHPNRKTAGVLFLNEEGTENGGLIFGGEKDKNGKVSGHGHLSFDAYEQDQIFSIDAGQEDGKHSSAVTMIDRPDYPIGELIDVLDRAKDLPKDKQQAEISKFSESHPAPHSRLYLGRADDKSVSLKLKDADGHDRVVIEVASDGSPAIRFLDSSGKVVSQLPQLAK
jgi:hypothetical protein